MEKIIFKNLFKNKINKILRYGIINYGEKYDEFIPDNTYLFIELGEKMAKFESVQGDSLIEISVVNEVDYTNDDEKVCRSNVDYEIFDEPFCVDYYIYKVVGYNAKVNVDKIICAAIEIEVKTETGLKQKIFIETGFSGVIIGGMNRKKLWIENYLEIGEVLYGKSVYEENILYY